jgi:hypothetical protein
MTEPRDAKDPLREFSEVDRAWMRANLPELRTYLTDDIGILRAYLVIAFFVGLAAHVAGYLLKSSSPAEPIGLFAELLYALGFAMWTGVVVALFLQVLPEAKRRQIQQAVEAVEASIKAEEQSGTKPQS